MDNNGEVLYRIWKTDTNEGYVKAGSIISDLMLKEINPDSKNIHKKNNYGETHTRNFV